MQWKRESSLCHNPHWYAISNIIPRMPDTVSLAEYFSLFVPSKILLDVLLLITAMWEWGPEQTDLMDGISSHDK